MFKLNTCWSVLYSEGLITLKIVLFTRFSLPSVLSGEKCEDEKNNRSLYSYNIMKIIHINKTNIYIICMYVVDDRVTKNFLNVKV